MGAIDFDDAGMIVQPTMNFRAVFQPLNGVVIAAAREGDFGHRADGPDGVAQPRLVHLRTEAYLTGPKPLWARRNYGTHKTCPHLTMF